MKTILIFGLIFAGVVVWFLLTKYSTSESDIIANNGLHWHADLSIKISGQEQDIPAGIGLGGLPHKPVHTHDRDGVIHMEFSGLVRKEDIKLGKFFQIWGKTFNKDCIFDKCSGSDGQLKMLVNGKDNPEFENYVMRDGDKIEIIFEPQPAAITEIKEITVTGTEFVFFPSAITVKEGQKVKINFQNQGAMVHNLVIEELGIATKTVGSGETDAIEFTAPATGTYKFFCSLPGHQPAGMEGSLNVE